MKKRWLTVLLAMTLCTAEVLPATALEETIFSDETELAIPQSEREKMPVDAPGEAGEAEEIIEDVLLTEEAAQEEATPEEAQILPEPAETSENDLTIDLSDALNSSVIDESETLNIADDVFPGNIDTSWGTNPAADAEQTEILIDEEHFPDDVFRDVLKKFDKDDSEGFNVNEIATITEIDVIGKGISNLTGISYFTALTTLQCDNNVLTTLDVSKNTKLKTLTCTGNQLTSLDLSNNPSLLSLVCSGNQLTALKFDKNKYLQDLRCARNQLQTLDLSNNSWITWLDCGQNKLKALDVSNRTSLCYLFCNDNQLSSLNVKGATNLQWLDCSGNLLTELDVTGVLNVKADQDSAMNILNCADNHLTSLDVNGKSYFKGLICNNNAITKLDPSNDPDLRQLECANNALTSLDVTKNTKLQTMDCSGNQLTSLDLSKLSITETTVLPNCSNQDFIISLKNTDSGYQADLTSFIGSSTLTRLSKEELLSDDCTKKSVKSNMFLLTQEGTLQGSILSFSDGEVPETIELVYATGYRKKAGQSDVLLEINLHCHIHTYVELSKTEPTCTENGILRQKCRECQTTTTTILPATGHSYQKDPDKSKDPTCTSEGYLVEICRVCGNTVNQPIPTTEHSYRLIKNMPTCEKDGSMYQQCSMCGEKKVGSETPLPAKGHNFVSLTETAPTCTKTGTKLEKCARCGEEKTTVLPATGHSYQKVPAKSTDPTCTESGILKEQCTTCGTTMETVLLATGHHYQKNPAQSKDPTCTEAGYLTELCTACSITRKNSLPATGHTYGEFMITQAATIFTTGTKSRTCSVCGNVETETIPKLNEPVTIATGKKLSLKPALTSINSQQKVSYKSSNPKIAKVSAKGVITGLKKGTAKITVKSGNEKYVVKVKITTPTVKKIRNIPAKKKLRKGEIFRLKPQLAPIGCSQKITYKSSNKKVATVTAKGKVKAKRKGTAKITVTAGNVKKVCKIVVR